MTDNVVSFQSPNTQGGRGKWFRRRERGRHGDTCRKIGSDVAHIESDIAELKTDVREFRHDMRDVRERLVRLEEKVAHLPGKGFIVASVLLSLAVIGGFVTFQGQIQRLAGTQPFIANTEP